MSDTKFTPGPWRISPHYDEKGKMHPSRWRGIYEPVPGQELGSLSCVLSIGIEGNVEDAWLQTSQANADLIAAAPELYEALDRWFPFIETEEGYAPSKPWVEKARAALAKARGETP